MTTDFTQPASSGTLSPELERLARRRVNARTGWFTHAFVYGCVVTGLSLVAVFKGHALPLGVALGWGFGLLMHGLSVFALGRTTRWRMDMQAGMLQRERERLRAAAHAKIAALHR
jgi:hypothetical protein